MYYGEGRRRVYADIMQTPNGDYALKSSYDANLVAELKNQIPATDREWEPREKIWLFTEGYLDTVADIVVSCLGVPVSLQEVITPAAHATESKLVKVEYLGAAKDRGSDEPIAYGYVDGGWSVAFPLSVLKTWFQVSKDPQVLGDSTYYAVLGLKRQADTKEIKGAYRRVARQWHPDVCKEPDANAMFQQINHAYQVLSDEMKRRKYDAALALMGTGYKSLRSMDYTSGWRPPLRCGWLLVKGRQKLSRFQVAEILVWEDVTNGEGRIMVSSWPAGAKRHEVVWV